MTETPETLLEKLYEIEIQKKWEFGDGFTDAEAVAQLSTELTDYARYTGDLRYLNTALKLNDWIRENVHDETLNKRIDRTETAALDALRADLGVD